MAFAVHRQVGYHTVVGAQLRLTAYAQGHDDNRYVCCMTALGKYLLHSCHVLTQVKAPYDKTTAVCILRGQRFASA